MYVDVNIRILTQKQHKQEQDEPILLSIEIHYLQEILAGTEVRQH
jgi:hypothetical protein